MLDKRASGILLHVTSLPSAFGIGDLGPEAYNFIDFLKNAGQRYWQILPLNPTRLESGNSPYSSPSAFAGNTLLISPELLCKQGYLSKEEIEAVQGKSDSAVDFAKVTEFKHLLFKKAFATFRQSQAKHGYEKFCAESAWLDDYATFLAIKEHVKVKSWAKWDADLKWRKPAALDKAKRELQNEIEQEKFLQYIFHQQWTTLRAYAHENGVQIFGDLPFYVAHESADVWTHPHLFRLDKNGSPAYVAGVPPDYFSNDGQLWGNPVFNWDEMRKENFEWWVNRIGQNLKTVDVLRLDHFRAFSAYWEVPAKHRTARKGKWMPTPGHELFDRIKERFPEMPLIAEDLGEIDEPVYKLRDHYSLPGMRLLLYAFNASMTENAFLPHNHVPNCVVYTGTHDNISVRGWFEKHATGGEKRFLKAYAGQAITKTNVAEVMLHMGLMSVAKLAIFPLQDVLGLGAESIMNRPGTAAGNWKWRASKSMFSKTVEKKLGELMKVYGREIRNPNF